METNPSDSHFTLSSVYSPKSIIKKTLILQEFEEFSIKWYKILHRQATRKEERNYLTLHFDTDCEIALLCQKKDSYTDSVYSKDTLGTILTISQRFFFQWISIYWFHLLRNRPPPPDCTRICGAQHVWKHRRTFFCWYYYQYSILGHS